MQRALAQLETEGLVRTERTAGRYVTEDTALIEQLRSDTARTLASDFLEKDARHRLQSRTGGRAFGTLGRKGEPQ